jgi:Domain of unknown function (DUF3597)
MPADTTNVRSLGQTGVAGAILKTRAFELRTLIRNLREGTDVSCWHDMNDSAKMNVWLHKQVMIKLAENGGKVPDSLKG